MEARCKRQGCCLWSWAKGCPLECPGWLLCLGMSLTCQRGRLELFVGPGARAMAWETSERPSGRMLGGRKEGDKVCRGFITRESRWAGDGPSRFEWTATCALLEFATCWPSYKLSEGKGDREDVRRACWCFCVVYLNMIPSPRNFENWSRIKKIIELLCIKCCT